MNSRNLHALVTRLHDRSERIVKEGTPKKSGGGGQGWQWSAENIDK